MRLALPRLSRQGLTPTSAIGAEAVVARARFDAVQEGALNYFAPVAGTPGFPRAAARTLDELIRIDARVIEAARELDRVRRIEIDDTQAEHAVGRR